MATASAGGTRKYSEQQMSEVSIGNRQRHDAPILLAEYSADWPDWYEREAKRIRLALGAGVRQLEHVGSTSVPGLAAKPVIDICLAVTDPADESAYAPALERAGYMLRIREPDWHEHRLFKGPDTDVNLHVFALGDAEIDRMMRFRDRLRTNSADRELYERTKTELAARKWAYVQDYADAKSEVIAMILERAAAEHPGDADPSSNAAQRCPGGGGDLKRTIR